VQGLVAVVDLHDMKVVKIEDHEVVDIPRAEGNYASKFIENFRPEPKPISITQPEGVNFVRKGNLLEWQKWTMRIGWNMREGLVLHTVGYEDKGVIRPVVYRASLSEMVVPYGSSSPIHCRKNAFDMG
jgi:primary-amine oxidase